MQITKPEMHDLQNSQTALDDDTAKNASIDMFGALFLQMNALLSQPDSNSELSTTLEQASPTEVTSPNVTLDNSKFSTFENVIKNEPIVSAEITSTSTDFNRPESSTLISSQDKVNANEIPLTEENALLLTSIEKATTDVPLLPNNMLSKSKISDSIPSKEINPVKMKVMNLTDLSSVPSTNPINENHPDATFDAVNPKVNDLFAQVGMLVNSHTAPNTTAATAPLYSPAITSHTLTNENQNLNAVPTPHIQIFQSTSDAMQRQLYDAKISIYPPELGHMIAKLKIDKNNAELTLLTQSQQVKAIVEANMPHLRENFQKADMNLTQVNIQSSLSGDNLQQDSKQQQPENKGFFINDPENALDSPPLTSPQSETAIDTLIDTYA